MANQEVPLEMQAGWVNVDRRTAQILADRFGNRENHPTEQTATTFGTIDHPRRVTNKRGELLAEAERIVNGARNVQYGDPNADFARIARYWSTHIAAVFTRKARAFDPDELDVFQLLLDVLDPHDVAIMMGQVKDSRLAWSPEVADHWLDKAGYSACGYHCSDALLENPGASA